MTITPETKAQIEALWRSRADTQRYTKAKGQQAELEFFVGAMAALQTLGWEAPMSWAISAMRGDPIAPEAKDGH